VLIKPRYQNVIVSVFNPFKSSDHCHDLNRI